MLVFPEFSSQLLRASSPKYLRAPVKATQGLLVVLEENEIDPVVWKYHIEWVRRTPVSVVPAVVLLMNCLLSVHPC